MSDSIGKDSFNESWESLSKDEQKEFLRLRKELELLRAENEFLKKAEEIDRKYSKDYKP